ncbi:hypothetical protein Tco_0974428 [Tanacetum coccineum]|uniref:Uncharacterized protein n=1 Tax=Tanacetum coccineum TaxID=301880 RepID=A0ABQ5EBK6_9ASTR
MRNDSRTTEAESMMFVTIQQDTSIIPPMTSSMIDLVTRPDSPNVHWPLPTTTTTTAAPPPATTTTTTLPLPPQPQQGASGTTGASDSAQAPPPPPPSSCTHQGDQSTSTAALSSSKIADSAEYSAWTTTDTRVKPSSITIPDDLYMDDETTADEQAVL